MSENQMYMSSLYCDAVKSKNNIKDKSQTNKESEPSDVHSLPIVEVDKLVLSGPSSDTLVAHRHTPWDKSTHHALATTTETRVFSDYDVSVAVASVKRDLAAIQEKYLNNPNSSIRHRTLENFPPHDPSVRRIHYKEFFNVEDVAWPEHETTHVYTQTVQFPNHVHGWYLKRSKSRFVKHSDRVVVFELEYTIHNNDLHVPVRPLVTPKLIQLLKEPILPEVFLEPPPFEKMGAKVVNDFSYDVFVRKVLASPLVAKAQGGFFNMFSDDTDATVRMMADSYATLAEDLHDLLPDTTVTVSSLKSLVEKVDDLVDNNKDLPGRMRHALDKIENFSLVDLFSGKKMHNTIAIWMVLSTGVYAALSSDKNGYVYFLISFVYATAFADIGMVIVKKIVKTITEYITTSQMPRHQGGSSFDIMETLTSILFMSACGSVSSVGGFLKNLSSFNFDRIKSNLVGLFKAFADIIVKMAEGVGFDHLIPDAFKLLYVDNAEIRDFALETDALHDKLKTGEFLLNDPNYDYIKRLLYTGEQFIIKHSNARTSSGYVAILRDRLQMLRKLRDLFVTSNYATDGRRPIPVVMCLAGQPNTLKSQTVEHLCYAIAAKTFAPKELQRFKESTKDYIYYVPIDNGFWDGYKPTHVFCVFQDFMQKVDVPGVTDNEVTKLMNACEESAYLLHMPALEQKGTTFFNSKFIVVTTNRETFSPNSIIEPAALTRRFTYWLRVKPKYEYDMGVLVNGQPTGRIEYDALPKGELGVPSVHPDFLNFQVRDKEGKDTATSFDFAGLVTRAVETYEIHCKWFRQKSGELATTANKYTPKEQMGLIDLTALKKSLPNQMIDMSTEFSVSSAMKHVDTLSLILVQIGNADPEQLEIFEQWLKKAAYKMGMSGYGTHLACFLLEVCPHLFCTFIEGGEYTDENVRYFEAFKQDARIDAYTPSATLQSMSKPWKPVQVPTKLDLLRGRVLPFFWDMVDFSKWYLATGALAVSVIGLGVKAFAMYQDRGKKQKRVAFLEREPEVFERLASEKLPTLEEVVQKEEHEHWYLPCFDNECPLFLDKYLFRKEGRLYVKCVRCSNDMFHHTIFTPKEKPFCGYLPYEDFFMLMPQSSTKGVETLSNSSRRSRKSFSSYGSYSDYGIKAKKDWRARHQAAVVHDSNAESVVQTILQRSSYLLYLIQDGQTSDKFVGMITTIVDTWIMLPKHFVKNFALDREIAKKRNAIFHFKHTFGSQEVAWIIPFDEIAVPDVYVIPKEHYDVMFIKLPRHLFKLHRRIDKYFLTKDELFAKRQVNYWLVGCHGSFLNSYTGTATYLEHVNVLDRNSVHNTYDDVLEYNAATKEGDCGSLFVILNSRCPSKIAGIHTAGLEPSTGYATMVYREMFEKVLEMKDTVKEQMPDDLFWSEKMEPCFEPLQLVDLGVRVHERSELVVSDLSGCWPCEQMAPGVLTNEAYEKARKRYARPTVLLPVNDLIVIVRTLFEHYETVSLFTVERRVLTFEEAVGGIAEEEDYGPISRKTSCGYPICVSSNHFERTKEAYFGKDGPIIFTPLARKLQEKVVEQLERAKQGYRIDCVYTDNMKDERVTVAKALMAKTRLFSGVPLAYLIMIRMYFGQFMLWITKNRVMNGSAIGVNPYEEDWNVLFREVVGSNDLDDPCYFAGDFKGFDQSGKPTIYLMIVDHINGWYADCEDNQRIRRILWLELIQSKHIRGRLVYEWSRSLPSGHPMTSIVNTIYNHVAYRYCFYRACDRDYNALVRFRQYVRIVSFGDDVVGSVVEEWRDRFNEVVISPFMEEIGLTYTTDLKEAATQPLRVYSNITFLKRSFVFCRETDRLIAPLDFQVILNIPLWTRRGSESTAITRDNVTTALRELSLWGRDIFNAHAPFLIDACKERLAWTPPYTTFESCYNLVVHYSYGFMP